MAIDGVDKVLAERLFMPIWAQGRCALDGRGFHNLYKLRRWAAFDRAGHMPAAA